MLTSARMNPALHYQSVSVHHALHNGKVEAGLLRYGLSFLLVVMVVGGCAPFGRNIVQDFGHARLCVFVIRRCF